MYMENRFKMLRKSNPEEGKRLLAEAQADVNARWELYDYLSRRQANPGSKQTG